MTKQEITIRRIALLAAQKTSTPVTILPNVFETRKEMKKAIGTSLTLDKKSIGKSFQIHEVGEKNIRLKNLSVKDCEGNKRPSEHIMIPFEAISINGLPPEEVMLAEMEEHANNTHRLKTNPGELLALSEFLNHVKMDSRQELYDSLVHGPNRKVDNKTIYASDEQKKIVNSTIQWLGSPVGVSFLKKLIDHKEISDYIK